MVNCLHKKSLIVNARQGPKPATGSVQYKKLQYSKENTWAGVSF